MRGRIFHDTSMCLWLITPGQCYLFSPDFFFFFFFSFFFHTKNNRKGDGAYAHLHDS